jgi:hypothetical protein
MEQQEKFFSGNAINVKSLAESMVLEKLKCRDFKMPAPAS